jgi:hypothetical protein
VTAEPFAKSVTLAMLWPPLLGAVVGAGVTFGLMRLFQVANIEPALLEAIAGTLVAVATFSLAYLTWQSVQITSDVIGNENKNHCERLANEDAWHRISTTQGILAQYTQAQVPITSKISITAYNGTAQIVMYSKNVKELKELKARFEQNPSATTDDVQQYRFILGAIPVVTNFYMVLSQMLRQDLLDTRLFMNTFAKTFLAFYKGVVIVNEVVVASSGDIERLLPLKVACENYLKEAESAREAAVSEASSAKSWPDSGIGQIYDC